MSERRSFSSNYRCCSQSRKISIGILADSKDIKDATLPIAENSTPDRGHHAKVHDGHTSLLETNVTVRQKNPTTCFKPKKSDEQIPTSLASSRLQSRSKVLKKESAANSTKYSAGKSGIESDECRRKQFGRATHFMDDGKVNSEEPATNIAPSNEAEVLGNDQVQNKDREIETAGNEALRKNLWKILQNISPNKHCPNPQTSMFRSSEDMCRKQSPLVERNQNSDKIESDSEKHNFGRLLTRSLTRKESLTKNQQNKVGIKKPTRHREGLPQKRMLSFKEDWPGRLNDNSHDGSLNSKRNKIEKQSHALQTHPEHENETAGEMQQSVPVVEKSLFHRIKLTNAKCVFDQKYCVFEEPNVGIEKNCSVEAPHPVMIEQQIDVDQLVGADISKSKDQQDNSLLKSTGIIERDPLIHNLETKSPKSSPKSKPGMSDGHSPTQKIFISKGIRSFKSLSSSKSAEGKANDQLELSDGRCELHENLPVKPTCIMEDNSENQMSKSSTNSMDMENEEEDLDTKDDTESEEQLSPEDCIGKMFQHGTNKRLGEEKYNEMTECIPESKSFKGTQENCELLIYSEENHADGLARAVALFNVALCHIKMKLKSMSNKRSAEILWAAAEEIFLLFQNAESQIKTDVGKLTNVSQSKRKQFENRFKEHQEQLLGMCKRFKDEIDRHLKDYDDIIEDVEDNFVEVKRTVEKQRAVHKMLISQVEQEIKVQLEDAESRIMAVQELAKEKMLQLKRLVAESVKHV